MKLGKRTAQLLREAIVLAHVHGAQWGEHHDKGEQYPKDSDVVFGVLAASVTLRSDFPALAKLDEAQAAYEARKPFLA